MRVHFEHWQYTFQDEMLVRYGSRYYTRKQAAATYVPDISTRAVKLATHDLDFLEAQILCGNEAFPEAAVANPLADLEVWDEWKSGLRDFPYPGRYSRLGITRQEDKISSPSSVGVIGEIMAGFFAQAGVSPWVLVRVVRRWPDFIFSHPDGTYSFVEAKAFTPDPEAHTGLLSLVHEGLLADGVGDAAQQLTSDPFGRVWYSYTHIRDVDPFALRVTFVEFNVSYERRRSATVRTIPPAVAEGIAERAVNQAAAKLRNREEDDLWPDYLSATGKHIASLQGAAENEIKGLLTESFRAEEAESAYGAIRDAIQRLVRKLEKRKGKRRRFFEEEGRRLSEAKESAAAGQFAPLRRMGEQTIFLADLPTAEQVEARSTWFSDWTRANRPWGHIADCPLWRCGGAVFCHGSNGLVEGLLIRDAKRLGDVPGDRR
jgi:hypothetical protein